MKAIVYNRYGGPEVLQLQEIDKPIPKNSEILVRVHASTVTPADCRMRGLIVPFWFRLPARIEFGFRKPKHPVLGTELAGEVVATGSNITRFKTGDRVYALTAGYGMGGYAEYAVIPEDSTVVSMPKKADYQEAAALPMGGLTALHFLNRANIRPGQKVMVYGASGSIGTYAVQLARHLGAEVTAVCSGRNVDLVRSLGADRVIDYTKEDITSSGQDYDVLFDTVGKTSCKQAKKILKKRGYYLLAMLGLKHVFGKLRFALAGGPRVVFGEADADRKTLMELNKLYDLGKLKVVIDRTYPLEKTAEAHAYGQQGHKRGNLIITIGENQS